MMLFSVYYFLAFDRTKLATLIADNFVFYVNNRMLLKEDSAFLLSIVIADLCKTIKIVIENKY